MCVFVLNEDFLKYQLGLNRKVVFFRILILLEEDGSSVARMKPEFVLKVHRWHFMCQKYGFLCFFICYFTIFINERVLFDIATASSAADRKQASVQASCKSALVQYKIFHSLVSFSRLHSLSIRTHHRL